ncbi:hypothetical protein DGM98_19905 [Xanthomonas citri]|uniref:Uncharacterized protein n=2 Tax=Xanthomonas TaxID=338 RepID=A0A7Z7IY78_XANCH|nr:hypothetical protein DGM98_19905 [Xanthomonas citri]SON94645.1 hypothetical protein XFF6990_140583 [Xanthomonas citri pv. fuscans]SOO22524.1 hypothetical protein XFF6991_150285 [Xanthomonas phaseoli pv. phaseoli]
MSQNDRTATALASIDCTAAAQRRAAVARALGPSRVEGRCDDYVAGVLDWMMETQGFAGGAPLHQHGSTCSH